MRQLRKRDGLGGGRARNASSKGIRALGKIISLDPIGFLGPPRIIEIRCLPLRPPVEFFRLAALPAETLAYSLHPHVKTVRRTMKLVRVETVNPTVGAIPNRRCEILKKYSYKGEDWYKLRDTSSGIVFDSPEIFWVPQ